MIPRITATRPGRGANSDRYLGTPNLRTSWTVTITSRDGGGEPGRVFCTARPPGSGEWLPACQLGDESGLVHPANDYVRSPDRRHACRVGDECVLPAAGWRSADRRPPRRRIRP